jgi:hypothetical protein
MPIIENEFDLNVFENSEENDEYFLLKRLSLYATIRPDDLKSLGADLRSSRKQRGQSLQDLFRPPQVLRHDPPIAEETEGSSSSQESLATEDTAYVIRARDFAIEYQTTDIRLHELPVIGKSN